MQKTTSCSVSQSVGRLARRCFLFIQKEGHILSTVALSRPEDKLSTDYSTSEETLLLIQREEEHLNLARRLHEEEKTAPGQ